MAWYWTDDIARALQAIGTISDIDALRISAAPVAIRFEDVAEAEPDDDEAALAA